MRTAGREVHLMKEKNKHYCIVILYIIVCTRPTLGPVGYVCVCGGVRVHVMCNACVWRISAIVLTAILSQVNFPLPFATNLWYLRMVSPRRLAAS